MSAREWRLVLNERGTRKTWHFFNEEHGRSRCGAAFTWQPLADGLNQIAQLSTLALCAGNVCSRCDRTRRAEEGR